MNGNNAILFLTGCINPKGMPETVLQDPMVRKRQYIEAITFYLDRTSHRILFVDNSNVNISSFFINEINSERLEILSYHGNKYEEFRGKGYGECEIIDYALHNSMFMRNADYVIKITGRLCVKNILQLIKYMNNPETVYAQRIKMGYGGMSCLSYLFGCPKSFLYDYFLPLKDDINEKHQVFFEHILYRAVRKWVNDANRYKEFYLPIQLLGQSGSSGKKYICRWYDYVISILKYVYHITPLYK